MVIRYYIKMKDSELIELDDEAQFNKVNALIDKGEAQFIKLTDNMVSVNSIARVYINRNAEPKHGTDEYYQKYPSHRFLNVKEHYTEVIRKTDAEREARKARGEE